jgi:hypothetical protein
VVEQVIRIQGEQGRVVFVKDELRWLDAIFEVV